MLAHRGTRRPRDYCILDKKKDDFETWRDLHIVWLAAEAWITARASGKLSADTMYVSREPLRICEDLGGTIIRATGGGGCLHV